VLLEEFEDGVEALGFDGVRRDLGVDLVPGQKTGPLAEVDERFEAVVEFQVHSAFLL